MITEIDDLIHRGKALEDQIDQLTHELARVRDAIAARMGTQVEYYGQGVTARKWERVKWEIDKELLLEELSPAALDSLKEVVFTKSKLEQSLKAGHIPPRLYHRALQRLSAGWNVSFKILDGAEAAMPVEPQNSAEEV